ncbi:hypothetical protein IJD44_01765 [bacterium]|nr:hypothetical protein [bacterium]
MKKISFILSALILISLAPANAYVDNQYTVSPEFLQNIGYSAEAAKVASITNQDPYREPYVEKKNLASVLKRFYHYIVPGQYEDLDFYNHNGNFDSTSWKDY